MKRVADTIDVLSHHVDVGARLNARPFWRPTPMPIKSKAQRRKFAELLIKGDISPETFEEWNRGAGNAELPERLHPKAAAKPKRKAKSKRAQKSGASRAKKSRGPARKRG
jgi:hypothetical protein